MDCSECGKEIDTIETWFKKIRSMPAGNVDSDNPFYEVEEKELQHLEELIKGGNQ